MIKQLLATLVFGSMATLTAPLAWSQDIVVGGKGFTEQLLLAEMTSQLLAAEGFKPDQRVGMGSSVIRQAIESGQVDLYWEYTGTALSVYHKIADKLGAEEGYARIKELDAAKDIVWLQPSRVNNTYAIGMLQPRSEELSIASISELGEAYKAGKSLNIGVNAEFAQREDGLPGVQKTYGFEVPLDNVKKMDFGLSFQALRDKQVDAAMVTSTDGRIIAMNIRVLEDDKGFFPTYLLTPVVRKEVLEKDAKLEEILNRLSAKLDSDTILSLNAAVDVDKKSVQEVASEFLKAQGLL